MEGELWKALLRVIIFLPLVLLLAYWSIRFGASKGPLSQSSKTMNIVERIAVGPKSSLCIVKIGEQYLLIGISEQKIELLKELPDYGELDSIKMGVQERQNLRGLWNNWLGPKTKE